MRCDDCGELLVPQQDWRGGRQAMVHATTLLPWCPVTTTA